MNSCIQDYTVTKKERDYENTVVTLRLTSPEAVRFWHIMDAAKQRNPYAGKSDIYRELMGLTPATALTEAEILFFRTGEKAKPKGMPVAPRSASSGIPLINTKRRSDAPHKKKNKRVA